MEQIPKEHIEIICDYLEQISREIYPQSINEANELSEAIGFQRAINTLLFIRYSGEHTQKI